MRSVFLIAAFLLLATVSALAAPVTLNFENLSDGIKVTNQFTGLSFTNATAITSGVTLNELEFPPKSGNNVIFNDGGAITITFSLPVSSFEGYFTYDSRITIAAFDKNGNQIASLSSQFLNNLALSGITGSSPNELLGLSSLAGIAKIVISSNGSFVLDDFKFNALTADVPEPTTLALMIGGGAVLYGAKRRKQRKNSLR